MWGWLAAIIQGFFAALFGVAAKEIKTEIQKPKTIEDEKTPPALKSAVDADIAGKLARMRGETGSDGSQR